MRLKHIFRNGPRPAVDQNHRIDRQVLTFREKEWPLC
jgi:hypothetical protein